MKKRIAGKNLKNFKNIKERKKFIEEKTKRSLDSISVYPAELDEAQFKNCENMIGATSLPLGIAGPILIKAENKEREYYIPLSTTEGALVASVNRGCKAIHQSGGVNVKTTYKGITRGSVFAVKNLNQGFQVKTWMENNRRKIQKIAEQTSGHLKLKDIDIRPIGRYLFVRFVYNTGEAMGMNMATIATQEVVGFFEKELGLKCISVAGNFDIDKKASWLNFIKGRARQVWAEGIFSPKIVKEVLKTTPEKINEVAYAKNLIGSAISGSMGFNAHFANIIAAIFLATGQDPAHIVEGSLGITTTNIVEGNLYFSVFLPDLPIGIIGGGTNLPSQKEALSVLGLTTIRNGGATEIFSKIIGAAVLAGELSLIASLAQGSLAQAHQKLARKLK